MARDMTRGTTRWLGGAPVLLGLVLALLPSAAEAVPTYDTYVSANPVDHTPHARGGKVRSMATVNGVTVAVGDFTEVRDEGSGTWIQRPRIFAFDTATGKILPGFDPVVTGTDVFDVVPAADGQSVYVAGLFNAIDGQVRTQRLARIAVPSGEVITTFKSPGFNAKTTELALDGDRLYVGGWFTKVAGRDHTLVASVDAATGAITDQVDLEFTGTFNGGSRGVTDMAMRPDGSKLVVIGNWTTVEGQSRPQIAMVDLTTPVATLDPWATSRYGTACSRSFETYMWGVTASPDGSYFAVGTTGAYSGGPAAGTLCDTVARWEFGRSGAGQQPTWVHYTGGDTVTQVEATDAAIYVGGHFRWMNNPYGNDSPGAGAVRRMGLAALDPRNGLPLSWNPTRKRGWGVWGFTADEYGLWVGHDTDTLSNELHDRLGLFPIGTRRPPIDNTGTLPGDVYLAGSPQGGSFDDNLRRLGFNGDDVTAQEDVQDFATSWSKSRATFMVDQRLYTIWSDGTMTHRTFTGQALGAPTVVPLNGLTAFANEMTAMTSAWYDAAAGRLYYTLANDRNLYYRYFLTENKLVGAERFVASGGGMDYRTLTAGFVVDGSWYYRDSGGTLYRQPWSNGPVAASRTAVSGPSVDGVDWRSRALFLYAP